MIRFVLGLIVAAMPLFCAAAASDGTDLDFRPRNVDLTYNGNDFGRGDLGVYARQLPGRGA